MTSDNWKEFIAGNDSDLRIVGALAPELVASLEAQSQLVRIERACVLKIREKHDVEWAQFSLMSSTLQFGCALLDRPFHMTLFHEEICAPEPSRFWKLTIKTDQHKNGLFVATFHRVAWEDVLSRIRRRVMVRNFIDGAAAKK